MSRSSPSNCSGACPHCAAKIPGWWVRDYCANCGVEIPQTAQQAEIARLRKAIENINEGRKLMNQNQPDKTAEPRPVDQQQVCSDLERNRKCLSRGIISMNCEYGYSDDEIAPAVEAIAARTAATIREFGHLLSPNDKLTDSRT